MKQVEAVINTVKSVLDGDERFEKLGSTPALELLTKEEKRTCVALLVEGFENGEIEMKDASKQKFLVDKTESIKSYCNGLLNNHLRKDKFLNGGVKYEAKNPGSRAGTSDPQIKEMKKMLLVVEDEADKQAIRDKINARQEELRKEKAKKVTINIEDVPEELRHLLTSGE